MLWHSGSVSSTRQAEINPRDEGNVLHHQRRDAPLREAPTVVYRRIILRSPRPGLQAIEAHTPKVVASSQPPLHSLGGMPSLERLECRSASHSRASRAAASSLSPRFTELRHACDHWRRTSPRAKAEWSRGTSHPTRIAARLSRGLKLLNFMPSLCRRIFSESRADRNFKLLCFSVT